MGQHGSHEAADLADEYPALSLSAHTTSHLDYGIGAAQFCGKEHADDRWFQPLDTSHRATGGVDAMG